MKKNLGMLLIGIISLLAAVGAGKYALAHSHSFVATTQLPVAAVDIPAYTVITEDMVSTREEPQALEKEPVYRSPKDVVGKVSVVSIPAGALLYRSFALPQTTVRYTTDPKLEVLAIPITPNTAVGGTLYPGQRVNVYRVVRGNYKGEKNMLPLDMLTVPGAAAELYARDVLVVSVPSGASSSTTESGSPSRKTTPKLVLVAADHATVQRLVALLGEAGHNATVYVSLAPIDDNGNVGDTTIPVSPGDYKTIYKALTPTITPTPTPTNTPTPTPTPTNTPTPTATPTPTPTPAGTTAPTPVAQSLALDYVVVGIRYETRPGDPRLNHIAAEAVDKDGRHLNVSFRIDWDGGSATCPKLSMPIPPGECDTVVSQGIFKVRVGGGKSQTATVKLPHLGMHTYAHVLFQRLY